ncbi:MAG: transporter substrate-binding domain-containing protein [Prolixibacteraceae bacterium]|nr:transporter substrate-binding domain-containing protein [Prolixibacteraceae bacterium]
MNLRTFHITLYACLLLCYCVRAQDVLNDSLQKTPLKITVASEPDYPPFCFVDKDGNPTGFSVELFNAVAQAVNIEATYKIGAWQKIKQDLALGNIDALPFVGRTPEREPLYEFSFPYLKLHGAVFVRERNRDIKTLADLHNKEVIVMEGDNAEEFVRRNNISSHIFTTHTFTEAFRKLAAGEHDAVITQRIMGITLLKELKIKNVKPLNIPLDEFRQDFCIAVQKGDSSLQARLNEGLSVVIANDTYDKIHQKWFGPAYQEKFSYRYMFKVTAYIMVPLFIIIAIFWVYFLRREVRKKTRGLKKEIAEHKKTVQALHLRQLLLSEMEKVSKVGGWEYEVDVGKVNFTRGVYTVFGLKKGILSTSSLTGITEFFHPGGRKLLNRAFSEALKTGEPFDVELKGGMPGKWEKWIKTSVRAEFREGKVFRLYGNFMDISPQKETENNLVQMKQNLQAIVDKRTQELSEKVEKLNRSQKAMLYMVEDLNRITAELKQERQKLEAVNKELETFTYSVSHDLKAPLRGIDGYSKLLAELYANELNDEAKHFIKTIRSSTQQMNQLIEDLLHYSRLERSRVLHEKVNLKKIIDSILSLNRDDIEQYGFKMKVNVDNTVVVADSNGLMMALRNLMENAVKFSKASPKPEIEINLNENAASWVISVKDNGIGFDMKYNERIFNIFQRLNRPEDYPGTGIGLALVAKAMHRMGGSVRAESSPGKGATFFLEIPKKEIQ